MTNATAPSPSGGTSLSYDWVIPIPSDRSGRHVVVVIWQRQDPAGEAFFAVQDLEIAPATAAITPTLAITHPTSTTVHLQLRGAPNEQWMIEKSSTLAAEGWSAFASGMTDASGILNVDDAAAGGRSFYRAVNPL